MSLPRGLRQRLRIAALIALAAGLLFLAIETSVRPASDLPALLTGWGIHTALASFAFVALLVGASLAVASARVLGQLRASLARRRHELVALSTRLMSAQEEERRRLSRELHDEFGQSLTAVNAYLWLIEQHPTDPDAVRARSAEARRVVARTLTAMRELSQL